MANTHDKVINIALNEVGYLEKKSNAHLESKTENAGYANYTKYGKWYGLNPAYWCAMFLCWIFHEAYGTNAAKQLLAGKFSAACEDIRQNFISRKQYITSGPKAGDIVFYTGSRHAGANHIGLIVEVSNGKIYTVEGNTSGGSSVIDNGGGVVRKSYALTHNKIMGYGRPNYDDAPMANTPAKDHMPTANASGNSHITSTHTPAYTRRQFILDIQSVTGAKQDGIAGPETLSKTITVSKTKNRRHAAVKFIQKYLNTLGHNCGVVDGIAGVKFDNAVKSYQKAKNCIVDGEITAGKNTWRSLLGLR